MDNSNDKDKSMENTPSTQTDVLNADEPSSSEHVVEPEDIGEPIAGDSDVLIQPKNTGLCSTDRSLYRGYVPFRI